ncbi:MAG: hypothetical protein A2W52_00870 [Candidatus Taylorbacteria bacterium RIFCSPHIGHO2_02_49_25]|uniref:Polymer-forming cytoskeletal protein n=1 Tax=Candidatus Taylorbacteria bacterium RIFCSPHIGHO2_02_49_25 TaxID=1802305 RepID=A0A1G2MAH9_9BACT|nr:MAG: hypothetical protein A2W52_00870 [Candidatus Taylorbacteria bacterium RIFCSPHIGHO2_02_49_25]HCB35685.1 hypothetical protein [Candidatus Taylorbacteria bacterium]
MLKKSLITAVIALSPLLAVAASINLGDYFLKGAENAPGDVYAAGETIVFAGSVSGDALAAGRTIFSQSRISNDVFFAGGTVRVEGAVGDDVRVLGRRVEIDGIIAGDVVIVGSRVLIKPTAVIGGSLYAVTGEIEVRGTVQGGGKIMSSKFLLSGAIENDLELWGGAIFKEPARIGGDFIHHARGKWEPPTHVAITGRVIAGEWRKGSVAMQQSSFWGLFFLKALMMLSLGFLLFLLARGRTEKVLLETLPNFWTRALRGFLIFLLLPLGTLIFLLSVVGIPIALMLGSLLLLLFLLSWAGAGILLGAWCERAFFKRSAFPLSYRPVLLGTLLLSVVSLIPFVGPVIHGMLLLSVAGSLGTIFFRSLRALGA